MDAAPSTSITSHIQRVSGYCALLAERLGMDADLMRVASRLHDVLAKAVSSPQAKAFFDSVSNEAWATSPEELARFQLSETEKWGKVIRAANIQPE